MKARYVVEFIGTAVFEEEVYESRVVSELVAYGDLLLNRLELKANTEDDADVSVVFRSEVVQSIEIIETNGHLTWEATYGRDREMGCPVMVWEPHEDAGRT